MCASIKGKSVQFVLHLLGLGRVRAPSQFLIIIDMDSMSIGHAFMAFVCCLLCQGASASCLLEEAGFLLTWTVLFTWIQSVLLSTPYPLP